MTEITALVLPEESQFRAELQAINKFQQVVHANMVRDQDYGIIPGTTKPTLLKPGAEKIAKLLGLADHYEVVDKIENWEKPLFHYQVKCQLVHIATGNTISEGLGECNSMESKYRWRWVSERDLPFGLDKTGLVTQIREAKSGGHWTVYRLENDDIFSQVNTILKMAKKRALVDASLSAGRLSNVFTQDIEDIESFAETPHQTTAKPEQEVGDDKHFCKEHNALWFKKGKMNHYAHPIGDTGEWCNEPEDKPKSQPKITTDAPPEAPSAISEPSKAKTDTRPPTWEELRVKIAPMHDAKREGWSVDGMIKVMEKLGATQLDKPYQAYATLSDEKKLEFAELVKVASRAT